MHAGIDHPALARHSPGDWPSVPRESAWTAAGATAGALLRYGVAQTWTLGPTMTVTAAAAVFIGVALVAPLADSARAALIGAGGAASSISAVVTQAASASATQAITGLAAFFVCAVAGVLLGMLAALPMRRDVQREERR